MRRQHHDDKFDDAFDERGILRDGKSVRVSLTMMDSLNPVQRAVASSFSSSASVTDGSGGTTVGLHRPGFRIPTSDAAATTAALDSAYRDYETNLTSAYKNAAVERTETHHDQRSAQQVTQDHRQTMDEVYAGYDQQLQEAWRA